jgi:adenylosuccinate synthase
MGADEIARCEPVYETIPGWSQPTSGVTQYDQLPPEAKNYLKRIEEVCEVPIHIVSTSPDRAHTMVMTEPFGGA